MVPLRPIVHWLFATLFLVPLVACGGGGGGGSATDPATEAAVSAASLDDTVSGETLLADDLLDDQALDGAVYTASVSAASIGDVAIAQAIDGEAVLPVAWGRRRIGPPDRTVTVDQQGDIAHVAVETQVEGNLFVDTTDDGVRNPGSKPFAHTLHRAATYERVDGHWALASISPTDMPMTDTSRQTVHIERLTATRDGEVLLDVTDPTRELPVAEVPLLTPGDTVVVAAEVAHDPGSVWTPDTFVFLHHDGVRDPMHDDGLDGDAVAGDRIYSRSYTIGDHVGRRFAVVDAIDSATLQNESSDDYAAHGWGVPYRVVGADVDPEQARIRAMVESEGWLAPLVPMDRLQVAADETSAGDDTAILPAHWGRRPIGTRTRSISIEIAGGVADVAVTTHWLGRLYVDTSFDGRFNPGAKPTDETAVHSLRYENDGSGWQLAALSLGEIDLTDATRQSVAITGMTITKGDGTVHEITDPAALHRVGDGLFTVGVGERVTVTATVDNATTSGLVPDTFLFLHVDHRRTRMFDDGTHGDGLAGDGVFTAAVTVGPQRGRNRLVVDAIDSLTLQNEVDDDYNANRWIVPFRVARPSLVAHLPFVAQMAHGH